MLLLFDLIVAETPLRVGYSTGSEGPLRCPEPDTHTREQR